MPRGIRWRTAQLAELLRADRKTGCCSCFNPQSQRPSATASVLHLLPPEVRHAAVELDPPADEAGKDVPGVPPRDPRGLTRAEPALRELEAVRAVDLDVVRRGLVVLPRKRAPIGRRGAADGQQDR